VTDPKMEHSDMIVADVLNPEHLLRTVDGRILYVCE